jgi:very-short-patch-repair endonuclease
VTFYFNKNILKFREVRRLCEAGFHKIRLKTTNLNQNLQQVVSEFAAYVLKQNKYFYIKYQG